MADDKRTEAERREATRMAPAEPRQEPQPDPKPAVRKASSKKASAARPRQDPEAAPYISAQTGETDRARRARQLGFLGVPADEKGASIPLDQVVDALIEHLLQRSDLQLGVAVEAVRPGHEAEYVEARSTPAPGSPGYMERK
jgi:hypothetical protein